MTAEELRREFVRHDATEKLRGMIEDCVRSELHYQTGEISASGIANEVIRRMSSLSIMAVDLP
jgi:hypothetical protein